MRCPFIQLSDRTDMGQRVCQGNFGQDDDDDDDDDDEDDDDEDEDEDDDDDDDEGGGGGAQPSSASAALLPITPACTHPVAVRGASPTIPAAWSSKKSFK